MIPCITTIKFHIYTKIIIERKTSYYVKFSRALHKLSFFFFLKMNWTSYWLVTFHNFTCQYTSTFVCIYMCFNWEFYSLFKLLIKICHITFLLNDRIDSFIYKYNYNKYLLIIIIIAYWIVPYTNTIKINTY